MEISPEEQLKREKALKTARVVWMLLTPIFGILAVYNLYRWSQGKDGFPGFLSQSGMTLFGLAMLIVSRNKLLSYVFLALGMIGVFAGLVMVIIT